MYDQFGGDQQRHRQQEADVNLHVEQKRNALLAAANLPLPGREQQKRQPGEERDDDDPFANHQQRIVSEARPTQPLKERPSTREQSGCPSSRFKPSLDSEVSDFIGGFSLWEWRSCGHYAFRPTQEPSRFTSATLTDSGIPCPPPGCSHGTGAANVRTPAVRSLY